MIATTILSLAMTGQMIRTPGQMQDLAWFRQQSVINNGALAREAMAQQVAAINAAVIANGEMIARDEQERWADQQQRLAARREQRRAKIGARPGLQSRPVAMSKEAREAQIRKNLEKNRKP